MAAPPTNQAIRVLVPVGELHKALDEIGLLRNHIGLFERELWRTQGEVNGLSAQRVHDNQLIAHLNQQLQNQQHTTQELFAARQEISRLQLEAQRLRYQENFTQASQLESLKQELENEKRSHGTHLQLFWEYMNSSHNEIEELKAKNAELEERLARADGAAGADGK
ncbi:hypothetical protein L5515_015422 [Caenorhabditis briggsae]|uniref:Uncharacterized protein n=1 Tax=Caenorhabditis briggsae TaxID=6238 RepID=A0AAE9EBS9_CAEBR|nr:hypothetical protein L5515_015422 [Caenorhabditis briggsae]